MEELKLYFSYSQEILDELARVKIVEALQVDAWLVHYAVKRNYDKHIKGIYRGQSQHT